MVDLVCVCVCKVLKQYAVAAMKKSWHANILRTEVFTAAFPAADNGHSADVTY